MMPRTHGERKSIDPVACTIAVTRQVPGRPRQCHFLSVATIVRFQGPSLCSSSKVDATHGGIRRGWSRPRKSQQVRSIARLAAITPHMPHFCCAKKHQWPETFARLCSYSPGGSCKSWQDISTFSSLSNLWERAWTG
jgi:hypothetical protein